jgi:hypothetical protein
LTAKISQLQFIQEKIKIEREALLNGDDEAVQRWRKKFFLILLFLVFCRYDPETLQEETTNSLKRTNEVFILFS